MRILRAAVLTTVAAGTLALAAPALATPTCPGANRSLCGGRIVPEADHSAGFLTYAEWIGAMKQLQTEHPDRVRFEEIGRTTGDRPVYEVLVSDFSDPTPLSSRAGLYFNGDIHGDERDGTEGFARTVEDLAVTKDPTQVDQLRREVLVFTDANPDGWASGDVPGGPPGGMYTRENSAGHDLNREWPVVGFQNPDTNPLVDREVRDIVQAHGNLLHRSLGIPFAYGFDVHGSAGAETPPAAQLMLDVLLSADELDLTRSLEQVQMADDYMANLEATTSDNVLANLSAGSDHRVYRVGDWDTSWDIYGYLVSGGYADWQANSVTGLGAVTGTIELFLNGEPGQENTFAGFNQQIEAANIHSMRVAVKTVMDLARTPQQATLHLPGPVAYVPNRTALAAGAGTGSTNPVGDPGTRPPARPYPATTNRFYEDLAAEADRPLTVVEPRDVASADALAGEHAVVLTGDSHDDDAAFLGRLKGYAEAGGTVVLTDGALRVLSALGIVGADKVAESKVYAGYFDITDPASPLVRGARPLSRQTYEPVPVDYSITNAFSSSTSVTNAPAWTVDRAAWEAAGGRTAGTTGSGRASVGEIPVGKGRIRIIGPLLPNPSGDYNHPFGVADYSLSYWGYRVLINALDATATLGPAGAGRAAGTGRGPVGCSARRGFARASARRRGRGVRFDVARRAAGRFRVDIARVARGRRIVRARRVARFRARSGSFTWRARGLADGWYVAKLDMALPGGGHDVRRIALRRARGRFARRPAFARTPRCSLLRSFALGRPVFGGSTRRSLRVAYRLARGGGTVRVTVLRGRRAVRRLKARRRRGDRTYRLTFPARSLTRRGDYRVRIAVSAGSARERATLVSHRL
jgi:hypothetical protein